MTEKPADPAAQATPSVDAPSPATPPGARATDVNATTEAPVRSTPRTLRDLSPPVISPSEFLRFLDDQLFIMVATIRYHPQNSGVPLEVSPLLLRTWVGMTMGVPLSLGSIMAAWSRWVTSGYLELKSEGPKYSTEIGTGKRRPAPLDPPSFTYVPTPAFKQALKLAKTSGTATIDLTHPHATFKTPSEFPFPDLGFRYEDRRPTTATVSLESDARGKITMFKVTSGRTRLSPDEQAIIVLAATGASWPLKRLALSRDFLLMTSLGTKKGRRSSRSSHRGLVESLRREILELRGKLPFVVLTIESGIARPGPDLGAIHIRDASAGDQVIDVAELRRRLEATGIEMPGDVQPRKKARRPKHSDMVLHRVSEDGRVIADDEEADDDGDDSRDKGSDAKLKT